MLNFNNMLMFLIIVIASTLGIAILIWKWIYQRQFSISIPAFAIQKSVNAALPIATEVGGFDLQISEVLISLMENNRVHISTAVSADKNIFTAETDFQLSASLLYRDAKFYLSGFAIEKIIIGKITLNSSEKKHLRKILGHRLCTGQLRLLTLKRKLIY